MIWLALAVPAGLFVWWLCLAEAHDDFDGAPLTMVFFGGFVGLLFAGVTAAAVFFGLNGLMLPILHGNEGHHTNVHDLRAIEASGGVHGQFYLGSGQIDSWPVYDFYRTAGEGLVLDSADAGATVVYQDHSTPRVIHHWIGTAHPWWCVFSTGSTTYDIHVPVGSITTTTNLELP